MTRPFDAGRILREARTRARLSQRELARLAGTKASVVSRIETGKTGPTPATLGRLLAAAGFELRADLAPRPVLDPTMLADVPRVRALTPEARLLEVRNVDRFLAAARRV